MSVLVEFTVGASDFAFADAVSDTGVSVTLERFVPVAERTLPFVWVTGGDPVRFERAASDDAYVRDVTHVSDVSDSHLYRVRWTDRCSLLDALVECDGVMQAATADERWFFRVRFPDHDSVSSFYNCLGDVTLEVHRVWTLSDEFERDLRYGLTPEQRESVTLALDRGYFETPRKATLSDLADELDISQQALSDRVRRANEKILRRALRPEAADGHHSFPHHTDRGGDPA